MRRGARLAIGAALLAVGVAVLVPLSARLLPPPLVAAAPIPDHGGAGGGWSGIDVFPDGGTFQAVSDAGAATTGTLLRDESGRFVGIDAQPPVWLHNPKGEILHGQQDDAEGLDIRDEDGAAHIVFEVWNRLRHYPPDSTTGVWRPDLLPGHGLGENAGLEAVASDRFGRIYAVPERPPQGHADFPVYRFTRRAWMTEQDWDIAFTLTEEAPWRVTGADFGLDGALYLLERRHAGPLFRSRIRRVPGASALTRETQASGDRVYLSPWGRHGNLEGLGIWQDGGGHLRAVMVSDDNHRWWQRSEIVELVLPLAPQGRGE